MMTVVLLLFGFVCWIGYSILVEFFADKDGAQYLIVNVINAILSGIFSTIRDIAIAMWAWTEIFGDD